MELMKMVRWTFSQHKRKPKYVWLRKMKIINWVSSASEVIATWASLHNSLYFHMFDIFHSTTLKKKGTLGFELSWPNSASITQNWPDCLHYLDLWPPDKDSQRPQRSLQSIFQSLGQANKVWGPPDKTWPLWENPLWVSLILHFDIKPDWKRNI